MIASPSIDRSAIRGTVCSVRHVLLDAINSIPCIGKGFGNGEDIEGRVMLDCDSLGDDRSFNRGGLRLQTAEQFSNEGGTGRAVDVWDEEGCPLGGWF